MRNGPRVSSRFRGSGVPSAITALSATSRSRAASRSPRPSHPGAPSRPKSSPAREAVETNDDPLSEMRHLLGDMPATADASADDGAMDFESPPAIESRAAQHDFIVG